MKQRGRLTGPEASMKFFLRSGKIAFVAACALLAINGSAARAQAGIFFRGQNALLLFMHSPAAQSYLGVDIHDVDNDRATALKLKDTHGAEIVTVDHDAPANKAGLKVHDVVLEMNGQKIDNSEQLRHLLKETHPGQTAHFVICRDGQTQNISVELADRAKVEANAWSNHFSVPNPSEATTSDGLLPPSLSHFGSSFLGVFTPGSSLYVGAEVDVLGTQLASYFGISDGTGLLVKSVDEDSPAAAAGLKAGDVITKVNNQGMTSRSDWLKILHANRGKQVQVTVVRNRKEQVLNMQAGAPKKKG